MRGRAGQREEEATIRRRQSVRFAALYRKTWATKDSDGRLVSGVQQFDAAVLTPIGNKIRKYHDEGRGHVADIELDELQTKVDAFVANGGTERSSS
jgi:hypothetical protein